MKQTAVAVLFTVLLSASASAADEAKRGSFYLSVSNTSRSLAAYTFMLDELLTTRCGVAPSIDHLKVAAETETFVLRALKDGNIADAKARLAAIPCEKLPR